MIPIRKRNSAALAALLGLAACGPLVKLGDDGPAPARFSLAFAAPDATGAAMPAASITLRLEDIDAPQELSLDRLVVRTSAQQIEYLKDMRWTDKPARMLRPLLAEHLRAALPGAVVLGPLQLEPAAQARLTGRLATFDMQAASGTAHVTIDMVLITKAGRVATQRFAASAPASATSPGSMAAGLNTASNRVAADIAAWVAAQLR